MQKMLTLLYHKARLQGGNLSLSLSLKKGGGKQLYPMYYSFLKKIIYLQYSLSMILQYITLLQHNSNIKRLRKQSFFF